MATALQKQLAAIQATRKNELDLKAEKTAHARSLLFEPKVAAQQSFDVLYPLCREGFEDLCALDRRFVKYSNSLFSQASKNQDRDLLTVKQNEDLDAIVESFLQLVGSRLLLQAAQLAIEWLIRRFQAHERNTLSLVLTCLPYHATPVFLTLLSILPTKLPPQLKFLHRYTNAYTNPPREALVQAAIKNPSFFTAINSYVLKTCKDGCHHAVLISLWASVMVQSIDFLLNESKSSSHSLQQQRSQDLLTRILPVLNDALAIKKAAELIVGCHMIVLVLVNKLDLDDRLLDALMSTVALSLSRTSIDTGLSALALIADRKTSSELPLPVLRSLFRTTGLSQKLNRLSHEQNIRKLVLGLAEGYATLALRHEVHEAVSFFEFAMSTPALSTEDQTHLANRVSKSLVESMNQLGTIEEATRQQIELVSDLVTAKMSFNDDTDPAIKLLPTAEPAAALDSSSVGEANSVMETYIAYLQQIKSETGLTLQERNKSLLNLSFLNDADRLSFASVARLFETALQSKETTQEFLSLPLFHGEETGPDFSLLTFLARYWCSNAPAASKSHALQISLQEVKKANNIPHQDLQLLIPFLLCALNENTLKLRRFAAEIITAISRLEPTNKSSPFGRATIDVKGDFGIRWLSTKDSAYFLQRCILPVLEECVSDPNHIAVVLQRILEKRSSNESVEKEKLLGKEQKTAIFEFLSSHVLFNKSQSFQIRLLRLLNTVVNVAGSPRSKFLLPCLKNFVMRVDDFVVEAGAEGLDINTAAQEFFRVTNPSHDEAVTYICQLATNDSLTSSQILRQNAFSRLKTLWPRVSPVMTGFILNEFVKAALSTSPHSVVQGQAVNSLKSLSISSISLLPLLHDAFQHSHSSKTEVPSKKRRTSKTTATNASENVTGEPAYLAKLTLLMELVDNSKHQQNIDLFKTMFKALQELQNYGVQTNSDLSYLTNLTLATMMRSMHALTGSLEARRAAPGFIRPDLLVDCVRNTSYPQNRSSALLVLSFLAKQTPQMVLHSIMPIFTMMSATTARLSDEFSAHVVDQTIQDVMPILVQKLHEEKKDLVSATAEILLSFAAAFEHIPTHRRLQLFRLLASSLGAEETLFAITTALIDAYPANDEVFRFSCSLCRQFGTRISMATICKTLDLVLQGLDAGNNRAALFQKLIQPQSAATGADQSVQNLMNNILVLLRDPAFGKDLQIELSQQNDRQVELEQALQTAFEAIIKIFNQASPSLKQKSSDVLEHLLALFPFESLARSAEPLLSHTDETICKGTLNTLQTRIRSTQHANKTSKVAILGLLSSLTSMIRDKSRPNLQPNALACIDQICEKFGRVDPQAVFDAMSAVSSKECLDSTNVQVQSISYYCLASSLDTLQEDFIPLLKSTERAACSSLAKSLSENNEKLHNAVLSFFMALVDTIPHMVSEECFTSLLGLLQESALSKFSREAQDSRSQLLVLLASKLEVPLTARVIVQAWPKAARKGPSILKDLVSMVQSLVESRDKATVTRYARDLFTLFVEALDIRCQSASQGSKFDYSEVDSLEQEVIAAMLAMVLKINDTIFRPFFNQLLEWSSSALPKRDAESRAKRTTTLFNLILALSERLKSIFTPYFGYALEKGSTVLQDETSNLELRKSVLKALTSSFKHDNDDFWQSPAHFDQIVDALPAQFSIGGAQRIQTESISAFTECAVAASSTDHHKEMNARLLKLFRSDSARTRLAAVKCQQSLTERLGEEWLNNLPEMLPLINELQEDDDEEVEKETNRWIKLVENKLGESLNSMLQ